MQGEGDEDEEDEKRFVGKLLVMDDDTGHERHWPGYDSDLENYEFHGAAHDRKVRFSFLDPISSC